MTSINIDKCSAYRFGRFRLDLGLGALISNGHEIRLRPQAYEVLRILAENHGKLVTKAHLFRAIWGDKVVTDNSLTHCLIDIRRAIGDFDFSMIRTVPRRGFIFTLPVTEVRVNSASQRQYMQLPNSIVVLPFVDMSEEGNQRFFADGLVEEILNSLAQIPDVRVIARTSSFSFRERDVDIATIAEQLNVKHALEGSVRKSGARVRITVQLVETATSLHLWAQTYDREVHDVLRVESEVARAVANQLQFRLLDKPDHGASLQ